MEEQIGEIHVLDSTMFCGKSERLIYQHGDAVRYGRPVQAFNSALDKRYGSGRIASHSGGWCPSFSAETAMQIDLNLRPETEVIIIDEGNFFGAELENLVVEQYFRGKVVWLAYLASSYDREGFALWPFGSTPNYALLKTHGGFEGNMAKCMHVNGDGSHCERPGTFPQRFSAGLPAPYNAPTVVVGGADKYQNRCLYHHLVPWREEHLAVHDALRLIEFHGLLFGEQSGVEPEKLWGFNSELMDSMRARVVEELKGVCWELERVSVVNEEEKYTLLARRRQQLLGWLSYAHFFEKPSPRRVGAEAELKYVSRASLFDKEGLEERMAVLMQKGRVRGRNQLLFPN